MSLIVLLGGCGANAFADREAKYDLWLNELTVPDRYGSPCFNDDTSKKNKVLQLLSQFNGWQLTHVELAQKLVVLCPAQPEFVMWLTEQAERSLFVDT